MEIVLAWAFYLAVGVACLALAWCWLAPQLPRRARLAILGLLALSSVLAMAVTSSIPHNYHPGDLLEFEHASIILAIEIWLAVAGLVATLTAVGRGRTQNGALCGVGLYLMGAGVTLYWILQGEATLQAPLLVFVGATTSLAAASCLVGLARWQARLFGLAGGVAFVLAAETLRGQGGRGDGPVAVSHDALPLLVIGGILFLLGVARLLRSNGRLLARPFLYAAIGVAATALVLILRGPGEWTSEPGASSTTLYGLPLTLLAITTSLAIVDRPTGDTLPVPPRPLIRDRRPLTQAWPVAAGLLVLLIIAAVWHPSAEACVVAPYATETSALTGTSTVIPASPRAGTPRGAPDVLAFDAVCAHRSPGVSQIVYVPFPGCKWHQVDPSYPVVQASGIVQTMSISAADSPWIHTSHDLDFDLAPDPASSWLMLGGAAPGALVHAEVEIGGFPLAYRPSIGDHVTVAGRWVYDCGHEPKTEIHPAAVVADEHDEWRADAPGGPQQARVVRIWMNSAPGVVTVPLAPFDLHLDFPSQASSAGRTPMVKLASGAAGHITWSIAPGAEAADVHITPPSTQGSAYFELLLGYAGAPAVAAPPIYTVTFEKLVVHDNLHNAARNTTGVPGFYFPLLGFEGNGGWLMQLIAGHEWRSILAGVPVESGSTYPLASVPPVQIAATSDRHLSLAVTGYAENDPSDGVELASGSVDGAPLLSWDAGPLADLCCAKEVSLAPSFGAWTLYYHVTRSP